MVTILLVFLITETTSIAVLRVEQSCGSVGLRDTGVVSRGWFDPSTSGLWAQHAPAALLLDDILVFSQADLGLNISPTWTLSWLP